MLTLLRDSAVLALLEPESRDSALESAAAALRALRPDLFAATGAAAPAPRARATKRATFGLTEACRALKGACLAVAGGEAIVITNEMRLTFPCNAPDGMYDPELALRNRKPVLPGDNLCPRTCDLVDFTHPDPGPALGTVTFNPADLAHVLQGVSDEETRYYLRGVFFGSEIVGTNGHICLIRPCSGDTPNAIVPTLAIKTALKLGLDSLTFHANHVSGPGFVAKLIDGQFPDYKRILPPETESPVRVAYLPEMAKNDVIIARDGKAAVVDTETGVLVAGDAATLATYREGLHEQLESNSPVGFNGAYVAICSGKADFTVRLTPGVGASYINDAVIMPKRL